MCLIVLAAISKKGHNKDQEMFTTVFPRMQIPFP